MATKRPAGITRRSLTASRERAVNGPPLGVGAGLLAVLGAGRYSVDGAIGRKLGWVGGLDPA